MRKRHAHIFLSNLVFSCGGGTLEGMPTGHTSTKPQGALEVAMLATIRRVMGERGMTQDALARASGMSPSQLTNVFRGAKTARFSEVAAMCSALGLKLSEVADEAAREGG